MLNGEDIELEIDFPDNVDVTEILPRGWVLDEISCTSSEGFVITDIPNGKNSACSPAGTAQCTFVNSFARNIPTLSQWGLLALAGVLGIVGFMVIRRKRVASQ